MSGPPRVIKTRKLTKIMARYGIDLKPGGKHLRFVDEKGLSHPITKHKGSAELYLPEVNAIRRKFHLTPDDGVSDEEFYGRA